MDEQIALQERKCVESEAHIADHDSVIESHASGSESSAPSMHARRARSRRQLLKYTFPSLLQRDCDLLCSAVCAT
jgi:hypothetical protein